MIDIEELTIKQMRYISNMNKVNFESIKIISGNGSGEGYGDGYINNLF